MGVMLNDKEKTSSSSEAFRKLCLKHGFFRVVNDFLVVGEGDMDLSSWLAQVPRGRSVRLISLLDGETSCVWSHAGGRSH